MRITDDSHYTQEMLQEAMELLDDTLNNMGMFQRQRYSSLRKRFNQRAAINNELHAALDGIEISSPVK